MPSVYFCAVLSCNNTSKTPTISMHRFPADDHSSNQWLNNTGRVDLFQLSTHQLNSNYGVCSDHFKISDFKITANNARKKLYPLAVPTQRLAVTTIDCHEEVSCKRSMEPGGPCSPAKWSKSGGMTETVELPSGLSLTPAVKQRRRKRTLEVADVKREAATPDRSPSGSPRSLVSQRSPAERYSPATPVSMAPVAATPITSQPSAALPPRNYSDFMRSLAAKYNNNSPNEYFAGQQQNGLLRGFDYSRYGLKPGHTQLMPGSPKEEKKEEGVTAATNPLLAVHPHLAAFSGLPMLDVLSMVRPGMTPADYLAGSQAAAAAAAANTGAGMPAGKRPADGAPLDLSNMKRPRMDKGGFKELFGLKEEEPRADSASPRPAAALMALHGSACTQKPCSTEAEAVAAWGVDEVCAFVRSVDVCAEYAETFKEHGIDGSTLPLLSAEHLTNILNMKLGPALKLRMALSQMIGHCAVCMHCSHCHVAPKPVARSFLPFPPTTRGQ